MRAISAAEMTAIRTEALAILSIDCAIQRKTTAKDAWGSETETFATVVSVKVGIQVIMRHTPGDLLAYADLIGARTAWRVNFPYSTDVRLQDHLVVGTDTMVVQAILNQQSYSSLTTVLAGEIQ